MIHIEEPESNCKSCDFQTTTDQQLRKHFTLKHTLKGLKEDEEVSCRNCGDSFIGKINLMIQRKQAHSSTVAYCENYKENRCSFSSDKCYWNHTEKVALTDGMVCCYTCEETFESKNKMMIHRKNKHEALVRVCENFKDNNCKRQNNFCWFIHKDEEIITESILLMIEDDLSWKTTYDGRRLMMEDKDGSTRESSWRKRRPRKERGRRRIRRKKTSSPYLR